MAKIVFLQDRATLHRMFAPTALERLRTLGEVVLNDNEGPATPAAATKQIRDADIAITSWGCPALTADILAAAPALKAVLHAGGSVKPQVTPALWERGVRVSSAAEPLGKGVAESALGMTIACLKDMWRLTAHTRGGGWSGAYSRIRELYDVTIGVVGAGQAGKHYIRLLQHFDVDVLLYDPTWSAESAAALGAEKTDLDSLLERSDVVSLHAPSLPETHKMIGRNQLRLMKDDAILINTARGFLLDETALADELRRGRLFAALDVTDPEPPAADHPLRGLPNAILLPHIAGSVNNGLHRLGAFVVEEAERLLKDEPLRGEVTSGQMSVLA